MCIFTNHLLEMEVNCSVGDQTNTDCHKLTYCRKSRIELVADLSENDQRLLKYRVAPDKTLTTICLHHKSVFLSKYSHLQTKCCDPLMMHKRPVNKSLRVVTEELSMRLTSQNVNIKPGQKLCASCRNHDLGQHVHEYSDNENDREDENSDPSPEPYREGTEQGDYISGLNSSLSGIGASPLKLHGLNRHSRVSYAKNKLEDVNTNLHNKFEKALGIQISGQGDEESPLCVIQKKANDMDKLVGIIKDELKISSKSKKKQLLTIPAALAWTRKEIVETFGVSDYSVRQAQNILEQKGLIGEPDAKRGKNLDPAIIDSILKFYQSDEQSRVLPGMKDVVSVGNKKYERKRLVLGNLRELYIVYKREYPDIEVGFSKFCSLRPKWCILAGACGTHSVCVCVKHQNVKLLTQSLNTKETYKDLMKFLLCDEEKRDCMFRHCILCPPKENLIEFLKSKFESYDSNETVEYSQWVSTDRTRMIKCVSNSEDFIANLTEKLEQLIPHAYIASSQSSFIKNLKKHLPMNVALVQMDFSENYSFTIQDEVQGYHWTTDSCTLHSVVIHAKNAEGVTSVSSLCFVSEDLTHDVSMVYETQKVSVTQIVKENYTSVSEVHYFTDGCAGQYKNKYTLFNLCMHEKDFKLRAQWSFYAKSHGKSECDGIGGTVKRLARNESLRRPVENQIITTNEFFKFCKDSINGISFFSIPKQSLVSSRSELKSRFIDLYTLPGTRGFHNFRPLDIFGTVEARKLSDDESPDLIHNFQNKFSPMMEDIEISCGNYVACRYDNLWYFGMVMTIDEDAGDIGVKFLHPNGPSVSFSWPVREDYCLIPLPHVLEIVDPPETSSGRTYHFTQQTMLTVDTKMGEVLKRYAYIGMHMRNHRKLSIFEM